MGLFMKSTADRLASLCYDHRRIRFVSSPDRFSRQIRFAPFGAEGQEQLGESTAVIVGCGALGTVQASLLARAGVGTLRLIDRDYVEESNLQRQLLYTEEDARKGLPKAEAARRHLARVNSAVKISAQVADFTPQNAETLAAGAEVILDCTDNFETRYLINDLCVRDGRPWIYAAAVGAYAATMNILPRSVADRNSGFEPTACLACIFPSSPTGNVDTCDTAGILSTAVNFAASLQVTETLKLLTGQPDRMRRTLLAYDLWTGERSEISAGKPRPDCEVCGERRFLALAGQGRAAITLCGRNAVQIHEHSRPVDLPALARRLEPLGQVRANSMLLRFSTPPHTITVFADGRALIQGTTDVGRARSLYARYVGA
jgi:adenylyltransferase/sulfurtransferase